MFPKLLKRSQDTHTRHANPVPVIVSSEERLRLTYITQRSRTERSPTGASGMKSPSFITVADLGKVLELSRLNEFNSMPRSIHKGSCVTCGSHTAQALDDMVDVLVAETCIALFKTQSAL